MTKLTKYDIAISFTEKDDAIAKKMRTALRKKGFSTYYYKDYNQYAKNLNDVTNSTYGSRSNYGLVILSEDYERKTLTRREWNLLQTAKREGKIESIFIIKVNRNYRPTWINKHTIYERWNNNPDQIAKKIRQQVKFPPIRLLKYFNTIVLLFLIGLGIYYSIKLDIF